MILSTANRTSYLVRLSLMAAVVVVVAFVPFLGYIPLVVIKATTVHIPVIIGALLMGPKAGGILGGVFVFVLDYLFFTKMIKVCAAKGEHFAAAVDDVIFDLNDPKQTRNLPPVWKAFAPIVVLIVAAFVLMQFPL